MKRPPYPKKSPINDNARPPGFWVVTVMGVGLLRPGPGTWGSLAAIGPGLALLYAGGFAALALFLIGLTLLALHAVKRYESHMGHHDDSRIVIDEAIGMGIALLGAGTNPAAVLAAFVLFRFFDIVKPGPIGWIDAHVKGAAGVIGDDVMAGIFAALCTGMIRYAPIG